MIEKPTLRPFGPHLDDEVVVVNTDADEAGDCRVAVYRDVLEGRWPDYRLCPNVRPEDLE